MRILTLFLPIFVVATTLQANTVSLFNNFSIEYGGRTYTFPDTLGAVPNENYSGYAYNNTTYGPYVETIFWTQPTSDDSGWLPTENGFLELSLDYRETGDSGEPEYVMGFSFSKDPENPYPSGERIYGFFTGPSLDNLSGTIKDWDHNILGLYNGVATNLNIAQSLTSEGREFLGNTNNYINTGNGRGALVTNWGDHGIVEPSSTQSGGDAFVEDAKDLNKGLLFEGGQWSPIPGS
jgi:hypothetical protein